MSVIFIDLGCSNGKVIDLAFNAMDGLPRLKYDKVYAFDPIRVPE